MYLSAKKENKRFRIFPVKAGIKYIYSEIGLVKQVR